MLKKELTYKDYDGNEVKDVLWFHLNEMEIKEMDKDVPGGLVKYMEKIIDTNDFDTLIDIFKDLMIRSYGVKAPDGKHFYKSEEIKNDFIHSAAFPKLYMEFVTNTNAAVDFINGVVPADIRDKMNEMEKSGKVVGITERTE